MTVKYLQYNYFTLKKSDYANISHKKRIKREGPIVVKIVVIKKTVSLDCGKIVAVPKTGINENKKDVNDYKQER